MEMITFLAKHFIRNYQDTGNPKVREQYGQLSGIVGIVLNLCLFAGKLTAGLLSGAISHISGRIQQPVRRRLIHHHADRLPPVQPEAGP